MPPGEVIATDQSMITYGRKLNPRIEYRLQRNERIKDSASLAEKFPKLKTLQINLDYFDATGTTRNGGMKYKVNLAHEKSLFCFNCMNGDCVGGDFDLTKELAEAIAAKRKKVEGEMLCQGTRHNKDRREQTPCRSILRYKLNLAY